MIVRLCHCKRHDTGVQQQHRLDFLSYGLCFYVMLNEEVKPPFSIHIWLFKHK